MSVRDPKGSEVGTVEFVHLSDEDPSKPGAESVTVSPAVRSDRRPFGEYLARIFGGEKLPETLRERLLRNGFIRVDAAGLFAADRYVLPDQIDSVSDDAVTLKVGKNDLMKWS